MGGGIYHAQAAAPPPDAARRPGALTSGRLVGCWLGTILSPTPLPYRGYHAAVLRHAGAVLDSLMMVGCGGGASPPGDAAPPPDVAADVRPEAAVDRTIEAVPARSSAPGKSCDLEIAFHPSSAGDKSAALSLSAPEPCPPFRSQGSLKGKGR
jgi:hypothetical protein